MIIKGTKRIAEIDFLKGMAIILIVLRHIIGDYCSHIPSVMNTISMMGGVGIHIFFFCSGFGLYWANNHHFISWKNYLYDRFVKVYIPYACIIIIIFVVGLRGRNVNELISHLLIFKMFVPKYMECLGIPFWYMSTIFQLYLIYPFLLRIKERISTKGLFWGSLIISLIWTAIIIIVGKYQIRTWNAFFLSYLWEFSFGLYIADYLGNKDITIDKNKLLVTGLIGLGIYGFLGMKGGVLGALNDFPGLIGILFCVLWMYSVSNRWIKKSVNFASNVSYELYLTHILVLDIIFSIITPRRLSIELILLIPTLCGCIIVAWLYKKLMNRIIRSL